MPDSVTRLTLAIASGHDLSVVVLDGQKLLADRHGVITRGHSEQLMPELRALLGPYGGAAFRPGRIIVEIGPGSFTGLRIGLAAAHALGLAWCCPVLGVRSTLLVAAAATRAGMSGRVMVALGAPRGQVWLEPFELPSMRSLGAPESIFPNDVAAHVRGYAALVGTLDAGPPLPSMDFAARPRASSVALIPDGLLQAAIPLYVRPGEVRAAA